MSRAGNFAQALTIFGVVAMIGICSIALMVEDELMEVMARGGSVYHIPTFGPQVGWNVWYVWQVIFVVVLVIVLILGTTVIAWSFERSTRFKQ